MEGYFCIKGSSYNLRRQRCVGRSKSKYFDIHCPSSSFKHMISFMSEKMYRLSVLQIFVYKKKGAQKVKVKVESIFSQYNFCNLSA